MRRSRRREGVLRHEVVLRLLNPIAVWSALRPVAAFAQQRRLYLEVAMAADRHMSPTLLFPLIARYNGC